MKKNVELRLSHPEHSNMFLCEKCGYSRKVPGSSIWPLNGDCIAYVPYFPEKLPCSKCGNKMEKE